jgi:hypothetical protein
LSGQPRGVRREVDVPFPMPGLQGGLYRVGQIVANTLNRREVR